MMFRETGYDEYLYWFCIIPPKEDLKVIHKRRDALDEYIKEQMDERLSTYRMTEMKNELKDNEELLDIIDDDVHNLMEQVLYRDSDVQGDLQYDIYDLL